MGTGEFAVCAVIAISRVVVVGDGRGKIPGCFGVDYTVDLYQYIGSRTDDRRVVGNYRSGIRSRAK